MVELENWFFKYNAWSFTKHRLWMDCKLAYYFRYIGTALRKSSTVDIRKLKRLKNLKNRNALQGIFIHEVLENQMGQHFLERDTNEEEAKTQYIDQMEQVRKTAKDTLVEYYNGMPLDEKFFDYARSEGLDKLGMFFGLIWPQVKDLKYLRHEKFDRFKVQDIDCIIKADYVCKNNNEKIVVIDWKTGMDNEEYESDLQIGVYVIWAMEYYHVELEQVLSQTAYLTTGNMKLFNFKDEELLRIKKTIQQEFLTMNRSYEIEEFEPSPEPWKCLNCMFSTVCHYSKAEEKLEGS